MLRWSSVPMVNSPPGIQRMPGGAGSGAASGPVVAARSWSPRNPSTPTRPATTAATPRRSGRLEVGARASRFPARASPAVERPFTVRAPVTGLGSPVEGVKWLGYDAASCPLRGRPRWLRRLGTIGKKGGMGTPTGSALMERLVALCKRRGFIFQSSEIYGGLNGFWDYGPL